MKQVTVKKDSPIELEDLYIILLKKTLKVEPKVVEETRKQHEQYELYNNLNPRYFEEVIPLKEALENLQTSDIIFSSKFDLFRIF